MDTTIIEIQKIKKILEILDFSESEISKQLDRVGKLLMMKISIAALERKGYRSIDGKFDQIGMEKFLKENYSKEEIKNLSKEVGFKFIDDYFANIMKNITDERKVKIEAILNS